MGPSQKLEAVIFAIVEILGPPQILPSDVSEHYPEGSDLLGARPRVPLRYLCNLASNPLPIANVSASRVVDRYVLHPPQTKSCMPLEPSSFAKIAELAGGISSILRGLTLDKPSTIDSLLEAERKHQDAAPIVKSVISRRIERGPIGTLVKKRQRYRCALCTVLQRETMTFKTTNGHDYVEAHHVMPIAAGRSGVLSALNVIVLCATHHRQMHYGSCKLLGEDEVSFRFKIDACQVTLPKTKS